MMTIIKKYKMPLLIIGILLVVFIIYSYFVGGNKNNDTLLSTSAPLNSVGTNNPSGQAFVNQLNTLQSLKLNTALFSDPRFQGLVDISQPIPDQPQGRPNPFAPIGQDQVINPSVFPSNSSASSTPTFSTKAASSSNSGAPSSGR